MPSCAYMDRAGRSETRFFKYFRRPFSRLTAYLKDTIWRFENYVWCVLSRQETLEQSLCDLPPAGCACCQGVDVLWLFLRSPYHEKVYFVPYTLCAYSEDLDPPAHPCSLIRVIAVRLKKPWILGYLLSAQQRLRSDCACAVWSESSLCAHDVRYIVSRCSSNKRSRLFCRDNIILYVSKKLHSRRFPQSEHYMLSCI